MSEKIQTPELEETFWYVNPEKWKPEHALREPEEMTADPETPISNSGHRARVRERFRKEQGFDSFKDHEVLELLLTYGAPRRDMKETAKRLIATFGSLKGVFEARPEQLITVKGVGEMQATLIGMVLPLTRVCMRCEMEAPKQIPNRRQLELYCKSMQLGRRVEAFWVICVNAQCRVLGSRMIAEGSLSEVSAYPRLVMETALNYNAHSVFFCHNHPGGTCAPSAEDISSTLQLQRLLGGVGILVLDHMIIAGGDVYSMAQHGDIEFGARGRRS